MFRFSCLQLRHTSVASVDLRGTAIGERVAQSIAVRIYLKPSASGSGPAKSMCTVLKQVFLCRKTALLDMLVLVDFDLPADGAGFDNMHDVTSHV